MNYNSINGPVLVTGGAGFIGSHLVENLVDNGCHVTVLDNMQAGNLENLQVVQDEIHFVNGDVRDSGLVQRVVREVNPQWVFHLAANASVPGSVDDPVYDFETNCAGTFVLLNELRNISGCKNIVVASSGAVYGEPESWPIKEHDLLDPISPYGASKLAAEVEARIFHRVYGLPVVIARIFNSYGPRMARFVILDFLRKLQHNPENLEILGTGQQIRDFTFVRDTVRGLITLADKGKAGEAYNLSSGTTHSVTELAHVLLSELGLSEKTKISYTGNSWVGDAQRWEVAITKMAELGYVPDVTLNEGIQATIAWYTSKFGPINH